MEKYVCRLFVELNVQLPVLQLEELGVVYFMCCCIRCSREGFSFMLICSNLLVTLMRST